MEWNVENLSEIVKYINNELSNGRTMANIEKEEFKVNPRVISKRLFRNGYKKTNNQYFKVNDNTKEVQENCLKERDKKVVQNKPKTTENIKEMLLEDRFKDSSTKVVLGAEKSNIDIEKIIELQNLLEPIKSLLKKNSNKEVNIDIDFSRAYGIKQRTIKCDKEVLKQWDKFVLKHSEYKSQDLITQALKEYMDKYK